MFRFCVGFFIAAVNFFLIGALSNAHAQSAPAGNEYYTRIQPIFDNRCVACHSCFNAPCQLNLQSYSGLTRGATKLKVYDGSRSKSVAPTRLDIDGHSIADWRAKGFFDVVGDRDPARTLLMQVLRLRTRHASVQPAKSASDSNFCPADSAAVANLARSHSEVGMPYGLPPLSQADAAILDAWVSRGAPGPSPESVASRRLIPAALRLQVRAWESFFNGSTPREKLVARYLYEHLFSGAFAFRGGRNLATPCFLSPRAFTHTVRLGRRRDRGTATQ